MNEKDFALTPQDDLPMTEVPPTEQDTKPTEVPVTEDASPALPTAEEQAPTEEAAGGTRKRRAFRPLFLLPGAVVLMVSILILIIYLTTKPTQPAVRDTLFTQGLLPVALTVETDGATEERWGFINKEGQLVIPAQFLHAKSFAKNGLAAVEFAPGEWGYINKDGKTVIPATFEDAETFAENGFAAVKRNGSWGYIYKTGRMVVNPQFDEAHPFGDEGLALVRISDKYGYINSAGAYVINPRFSDAQSFLPGGYAQVEEFGRWGVINKKGEYVINPQFDAISNYSSKSLVLVKKDGKYGYIGKDGVYAILPNYEHATDFAKNGLALVFKDGEPSFIDKKGNIVLRGFYNAQPFSDNGIAAVQRTESDGWCYIDKTGQSIDKGETTFAEALSFSHGIALVENRDGRICAIDEKGKIIFTCPENCENALPFFKDGFSVLLCADPETGKYYLSLIDKNGSVLRDRISDLSLE